MLPTLALTFDDYGTTYTNALFPMKDFGITGTFFVNPDRVDTSGHAAKDNLIVAKLFGWEIGFYADGSVGGTTANMVTVYNDDRDNAADRLRAGKDALHALDFDVISLAASQRAWSPFLANIAKGMFKAVRVADQAGWQQYPIVNPLYVRGGATSSWSAADTFDSLKAQVDDLILHGGFWPAIIHKVSNDGDALYSIPTATFGSIISYIAGRCAAGVLRVSTFGDAVLQ